MVLVDGTVPASPARIREIPADAPFEKTFTAFASKLSVVFAAALVTAHDALDVLSVLVALSTERDQRTAGLRAGRSRRGALLRLVQMVATAAAAGWVAPRRRHQRHAPGEPAEIVVVSTGQQVRRATVRRALLRRRRGRSDARHAGTAATGHCA